MTSSFSADRRSALRGLGLLGLGASLSACVAAAPPRIFYLTALQDFPADLPKARWSLAVHPPQTVRALRTNQIAQAFGPNEFNYYANAEWGDQAQFMIQSVLIRSFELSGAIAVVVSDRQPVRTDFRLTSSLVPFFAEGPLGSAPVARVGMEAQLVRARGREIVGASSFDHQAQSEGNDLDAIVAAFDRATHDVFRELIPWTLRTGNRAGR